MSVNWKNFVVGLTIDIANNPLLVDIDNSINPTVAQYRYNKLSENNTILVSDIVEYADDNSVYDRGDA